MPEDPGPKAVPFKSPGDRAPISPSLLAQGAVVSSAHSPLIVATRPTMPSSERGSIEAKRDKDSESISSRRSQESTKDQAEFPPIEDKRNLDSSSHRTTSLHTTSTYPQDILLEGWRECVFLDRSLYYVHSTRQVIADVDLRDEELLGAVMAYLESHDDHMLEPVHQELWLRNTGSHENEFIPLGCVVDHRKQSVMFDALHETGDDGGDDLELDAEYRYWSFMETHPVHAPLPQDARADAFAVLTWNWTNQLLPSHRSADAPFTQEECQELTALIQSFDEDGGEEQTPLRTHIISGILLRAVLWRRLHPDHPLPVDTGHGGPGHISIETISTETRGPTPMDCGMMPSRTFSMEQAASRRRAMSSQGGGGQAQVTRLAPWFFNSYPNNFKESPHGVSSTVRSEAGGPSSPSSFGDHSHLGLPPNSPHTIASSPELPHVQDGRAFHAHGWVEYDLPDESLYYVHHSRRIVTDVDLSNEILLDAVMAYLEYHDGVTDPAQELWLRDAGSRKHGFTPLGCMVNHAKQLVTFDSLDKVNGSEDDRLDAKYRYWSFMEAHPAHAPLPLSAHQDAMNALNWASTNWSVPSHRATPAPFTQEECQHLTTLLQSFDKRGGAGAQISLRTYTIARIMLRVVCWRQSHFRPEKPLPADAGRGGLRRRDNRFARGSLFVLVIGVYTCLAASIALGPSITFVRNAGIGVVLLSLFLVALNLNVVAFTKRKASKRSVREEWRTSL
ncbi:hypothetical protein BD779DRAFT_683517 [Infundibulicybe gibba]|nr:hypothetical protein BD779DRAFT_683517 [Infundibulicybe gibba]